MSFRDRMKKKKGGLKKRHQKPTKPTGGRFPTIFNKKKIPEGIGFFFCKEGDYIVDILPWEAGPDMPLDEQNEPITEEGDFDYVLDLWVHQNVGKMKMPFVCPYENFGLPCPICEYIKANRLPKDEWNEKRPKRRAIYLIWNRTTPEEEKKGVQIFEAAFFFMEEKIAEIAKLPRGGGYVTFSDPDEGKSVCWTRKGAGQTNTNYLGHRFIDRESPVPDKILEQTFPLDSVIDMHPSYEKIEEAFNSVLNETSEEDDQPFKSEESSDKGKEDIDDSKFEDSGVSKTSAKPKRKFRRKKK